ncbi:serine-rich adhesin for platelets-like isoform X1 [Varroa jacobsoni]|uniref:serine-rich adhesin for platelets-like isoform X1 n=2 Tax=Varroa jacobsoni TaxID=62625 RepID=UPI000BF48368|nr:serine-rich adhesin for platelets-like isoform X1 [Varroa jacobsoni]
MTSFARAEEERIFLERCYRLYERVERVKVARVDNKTPKCMFGSYLGKQNELRKQLMSAGSTATGSSEAPGYWNLSEFTSSEDATIEQRIERFLILTNYKRTPFSPKKRFPYLRKAHKIEPSQPLSLDVMDLHASAFTTSYPRIVRRVPAAESKLRKMPLFYQKASISSEEPSASAETLEHTEARGHEGTFHEGHEGMSTASTSSQPSSDGGSSASASGSSTSSKADDHDNSRSDDSSDNVSANGSQASHYSIARKSVSSKSSSMSSKSSDRHQAAQGAKPSTASTVSTVSSSLTVKKSQEIPAESVSTVSSEKRSRSSKVNHPGDKKSVALRICAEEGLSMSLSSLVPIVSEVQATVSPSVEPDVEAVSDADTTHDVPPMESENSVLNEESNAYVDFLNDVTDVILGMGVFSPSAIQAAIDAALATNVYGDVDRERAQVLVEQLFA